MLSLSVPDFLADLKDVPMHGYLLMQDGQIVSEGCWSPFRPDRPHRLYSVSKSVVSLAIGLLLTDGKLSLSDPIVRYFPEYLPDDVHPFLEEVTIRDMLRMSTCYSGAQYRPLQDDDWTKPFFHGEPNHVPGTVFSYDTSASQVLCSLAEKLSGQDVLDFLEQRLFSPLGMSGPKFWLKDRSVHSQVGTGLGMTLRDFGKLSQFTMDQAQNLIDPDYLKAATTKQTDTSEQRNPDEKYGYGYQFWMARRGFCMYGLGGQMAFCLPEEKLSLCTLADTILSGTGVAPIHDAFFRNLGEDVKTQTAFPALSFQPIEGGTLFQKPACEIVLEKPIAPLDRLQLGQGLIRLHLMQDDRWYDLPCGNGCWLQGTFPASEEKCITSGAWVSDTRFEMHCELIGEWTSSLKMVLERKSNRCSVRLLSSTWEFQSGYSGDGWGSIGPINPTGFYIPDLKSSDRRRT